MINFLCILLIVLNIAGLAEARDFNLIDCKDLKIFEVEKSTPDTISEEFEDFLRKKNWLKFEENLWDTIRNEKEEGVFEVPELDMSEYGEEVSTTAVTRDAELPPAQIELPYQTRLCISGRKSISIKYGNVYYLYGDEDDRTVKGAPTGTTKGFEMEQELRVRIKGKVGEKITVNVNYDDTKPAYDENARKISIIYKGDENEIIKEAAFGDITLSIPSTKFVGYSKKVFGISVKGRYKKLNFMAIGSQTKGKTDVKEFTGQTTFTKKDIKDISYVRRRYYNIDIDTTTSHLPVDAGSVNIYIDDMGYTTITESNKSTMTVAYFGSTRTYGGGIEKKYFYKLIAGRDYYVDHIEGIITFNKNMNSNYVVAVEYKYNDGSSEVGYTTGYPVIIKDENEDVSYELKNRYNLGARKIMRDDFVLKFLDLNRNSVSLPNGSCIIDYELGIIKFTENTPFYYQATPVGYADIYDNKVPKQHYIIYVEYKNKIKSYNLRPNILRGSERVLLSGRVLSRDNDYIIDYPSGFLTFLNPDEIDETTKIHVTYEYMPFGGLFKETLVGMRGEYKFSESAFMGGTLLYNWASAPPEIPNIHSTPASTLVLDTDFNFKIPKNKYFPLPVSVNGEVAWSEYNPNTLGKAMIDNMEGIRDSYSVPTVADSWRIAKTPTYGVAHPVWLVLSEEDVYLSEINKVVPETDDEKKNVLFLNYSFPSGGPHERSIVYPISKTGIDLSNKDTIQMWIYGDGKGADIQIDFGSISEDADETGSIKTEDKNKNGTIDRGEDTGWNYIYNNSTYPIGANNGNIDTNDLDGDGYLDTIESLASFDKTSDGGDCLDVDWTGWKNIIIPRKGSDDVWEAVKHVRITVKGINVSGSIGIASLEAVGNKWEVGSGTGTLTVNAVNNYDNEEYEPLEEDIYEDIYKKVGGARPEKEQALELKYDNLASGTTAYVYSKYTQAVDFSNHNKINFLLYGDGGNADFFISFGAGNNFYLKKIKSKDIHTGWQKYSLNIPEDFEKTGTPGLINILEIRLGIINNTVSQKSGKLWVNEIYIESPKKRTGHARRAGFSSSVPGILDFSGNYQTIDKDFQTITTPPKNQDNTIYSANAKLYAVKFLPVTGSYSKQETITPADRITPGQRNPYLREGDAGEVTSESGSVGAGFSMRRLPSLKCDYSGSISESKFTGKKDITDSIKGSASYSVPLRLFIFPRNISGSYRQTYNLARWKDYKRTENPAGGYENLDEETIEYSGNTDFYMFKRLTLKPSYSKNEKYKTWDFYTGQYKGENPRWKWSQDQNIALSSNLQLLQWLRPNGSYSIKINENYNYDKVGVISILSGTKDVTRNFSLKAGGGIPVNKVLPWVEPVRTLNINAAFALDKGESYKDIENSFDVFSFNRLDQRYELLDDRYGHISSTPAARLVTLTSVRSKKYTANWSPFKFLDLNEGVLNLIGNLSWRSSYNHIDSRKETTGTILDTITEIWPDININYGKIDALPFTGNIVKDINLRTNYSFKEVTTISNDEEVDENLSVKYGANCRFLLFKNFDSLFEHSRDWQEKRDLKEKHRETYQNSLTYSGQVKFVLKKYWNLIVRHSYKRTYKEAYNSEDLLTDIKLHTPGITFSAVIDMPSTFKIPLIGKEISMINRLKVSGSLKAEFSRSSLNTDKTNTNKYMASTSAEMDVSSNMRLTFSCGLQYMEYIEKRENTWISFHLQSELVIRF